MARRKTTRRRSPRRSGLVNVGMLRDAGTFAAGFVAADVAMTRLPLPASFKASPAARALTTVGVGILAGVALKRFLGARTGTALATGMVANGIVSFARGFVPGVGEFDGSGRYLDDTPIGMLASMTDEDMDELAAQIVEAETNPFAQEVSDAVESDILQFAG